MTNSTEESVSYKKCVSFLAFITCYNIFTFIFSLFLLRDKMVNEVSKWSENLQEVYNWFLFLGYHYIIALKGFIISFRYNLFLLIL